MAEGDSLTVPDHGGSGRSRSPSPNRGLLKYFKRSKGGESSTSVASTFSSTTTGSSGQQSNGVNRCSFVVGVAEDRNRKCRKSMEDAHTYVYNFAEHQDDGYFAVFDGHAGKEAAEWCSVHVHGLLERALSSPNTASACHSISTAFEEADAQISKLGLRNAGTTAAVALLQWQEDKEKGRQRMLYVGNVGDTRVILCRGGQALRLSYDHKGSDPHETKRITNAGGIILSNRVNGVLAVTRALGDSYMKELVSGSPYTTATALNSDDEFLIVACDGLWDVCDDETAVNYIREIKDPKTAAQMLVDYALQHFSSDNLTCMVIRLKST